MKQLTTFFILIIVLASCSTQVTRPPRNGNDPLVPGNDPTVPRPYQPGDLSDEETIRAFMTYYTTGQQGGVVVDPATNKVAEPRSIAIRAVKTPAELLPGQYNTLQYSSTANFNNTFGSVHVGVSAPNQFFITFQPLSANLSAALPDYPYKVQLSTKHVQVFRGGNLIFESTNVPMTVVSNTNFVHQQFIFQANTADLVIFDFAS